MPVFFFTLRRINRFFVFVSLRDAGVCTPASRVFIFDYSGSLLQKEKFDIYLKQTLSAVYGGKPTENMMSAMAALSDDPRNIVVVVTGLTRLKLSDTFARLPNVTLATSNGLIYSWGANLREGFEDSTKSSAGRSTAVAADADGRPWECMDFKIDWNAVADIACKCVLCICYNCICVLICVYCI